MKVIFELNNDSEAVIENSRLTLNRSSFPIKVKVINKEGNETERIIFIRDKNGKPVMLLS